MPPGAVLTHDSIVGTHVRRRGSSARRRTASSPRSRARRTAPASTLHARPARPARHGVRAAVSSPRSSTRACCPPRAGRDALEARCATGSTPRPARRAPSGPGRPAPAHALRAPGPRREARHGRPGTRPPRIQGVYVLFDAGDARAGRPPRRRSALTALRTAGGVRARRTAPGGAARAAWSCSAPARRPRRTSPRSARRRRPRRRSRPAPHRRLRGRGGRRRPRAADAVAAPTHRLRTTAREPLFDGDLVPAHAVVVAVGSHEPDAREVDGASSRAPGVRRVPRERRCARPATSSSPGSPRARAPDLGELVRGDAAARPRPPTAVQEHRHGLGGPRRRQSRPLHFTAIRGQTLYVGRMKQLHFAAIRGQTP